MKNMTNTQFFQVESGPQISAKDILEIVSLCIPALRMLLSVLQAPPCFVSHFCFYPYFSAYSFLIYHITKISPATIATTDAAVSGLTNNSMPPYKKVFHIK